MADWQLRLDLKDIWQQSLEGEISLRELTNGVIKRLEALNLSAMPDWVVDSFNDVVDEFKTIVDDENLELTESEFNGALDMLYDWGDMALDDKGLGGKKVCWIATVF